MNLIDSDYILTSVNKNTFGSTGGLDSDAVTALIDSDYILTSVNKNTFGSTGGLDSDAVTNLITENVTNNLDGGTPSTIYGGTTALEGGTP